MIEGTDLELAGDEPEEVDALPVPAGAGPLTEHSASTGLPHALAELMSAPALRAVAMAAGGFVAGAAVVGLARRRSEPHQPARALKRRRRGRRASSELLPIVATRTLLVDVHLLGPSGHTR